MGWGYPLLDCHAVAPLHQGPRLPLNVLHDRVILWSLVAANMNNVSVSFSGNHAGGGAFVFQHGVGSDGSPVKKIVHLMRQDAFAGTKAEYARQHTLRRIRHGRGQLVNCQLAPLRVRENDVSKSPTHIDANEDHSEPARFAKVWSKRSTVSSRTCVPCAQSLDMVNSRGE